MGLSVIKAQINNQYLFVPSLFFGHTGFLIKKLFGCKNKITGVCIVFFLLAASPLWFPLVLRLFPFLSGIATFAECVVSAAGFRLAVGAVALIRLA